MLLRVRGSGACAENSQALVMYLRAHRRQHTSPPTLSQNVVVSDEQRTMTSLFRQPLPPPCDGAGSGPLFEDSSLSFQKNSFSVTVDCPSLLSSFASSAALLPTPSSTSSRSVALLLRPLVHAIWREVWNVFDICYDDWSDDNGALWQTLQKLSPVDLCSAESQVVKSLCPKLPLVSLLARLGDGPPSSSSLPAVSGGDPPNERGRNRRTTTAAIVSALLGAEAYHQNGLWRRQGAVVTTETTQKLLELVLDPSMADQTATATAAVCAAATDSVVTQWVFMVPSRVDTRVKSMAWMGSFLHLLSQWTMVYGGGEQEEEKDASTHDAAVCVLAKALEEMCLSSRSQRMVLVHPPEAAAAPSGLHPSECAFLRQTLFASWLHLLPCSNTAASTATVTATSLSQEEAMHPERWAQQGAAAKTSPHGAVTTVVVTLDLHEDRSREQELLRSLGVDASAVVVVLRVPVSMFEEPGENVSAVELDAEERDRQRENQILNYCPCCHHHDGCGGAH